MAAVPGAGEVLTEASGIFAFITVILRTSGVVFSDVEQESVEASLVCDEAVVECDSELLVPDVEHESADSTVL